MFPYAHYCLYIIPAVERAERPTSMPLVGFSLGSMPGRKPKKLINTSSSCRLWTKIFFYILDRFSNKYFHKSQGTCQIFRAIEGKKLNFTLVKTHWHTYLGHHLLWGYWWQSCCCCRCYCTGLYTRQRQTMQFIQNLLTKSFAHFKEKKKL